jgi:hypothetical protein
MMVCVSGCFQDDSVLQCRVDALHAGMTLWVDSGIKMAPKPEQHREKSSLSPQAEHQRDALY